MIVKKHTLNEPKLARFNEGCAAAYAGVMHLGDRLQAARDSMQTAQNNLRRWEVRGGVRRQATPPRQLTEPVEKYRTEFEIVSAEHERATERWQSLAQIADPLREAAEDWVSKGKGRSQIDVTGAGQREATRSGFFKGAAQ